jgi:hypothetical protein
MPVRRFRSVEELNQPRWREPGDPALYRAIESLWAAGQRSFERRFPPGVHRYRSIEELDAATERWMREAFERCAEKRRS